MTATRHLAVCLTPWSDTQYMINTLPYTGS